MHESKEDRERLSQGKVPRPETGIEVRKTICDICNVATHCGIDAYVKDGVVVKIEGTKENPNSEGTLCSKGNANRQYIYHKDRIHTPLVRRGGKRSAGLVPASWEEAESICSVSAVYHSRRLSFLYHW